MVSASNGNLLTAWRPSLLVQQFGDGIRLFWFPSHTFLIYLGGTELASFLVTLAFGGRGVTKEANQISRQGFHIIQNKYSPD